MISLITFPETFGEFAASPFCTKAAYLLQMSGLPWQREDTLDPRPFKYGKLPAIRANGKIICDSENIRRHLEAQGAIFDASLKPQDKSNARAFTVMAEEHMYFHQVLDRWGNNAVWAELQKAYFSQIPRLIRPYVTGKIRKTLLAGMKAQGLGRFSESERLERLEGDLLAIAEHTRANGFLFSDRPCSADASVAAMLGGMRASPVPTLLSRRISSDGALMAYVARMEAAVPIK